MWSSGPSQGQTLQMALVGAPEQRWLTSRVLAATPTGQLTLGWPLDTERFLPRLSTLRPGDHLALETVDADGTAWTAEAVVEALAPDVPSVLTRSVAGWRARANRLRGTAPATGLPRSVSALLAATMILIAASALPVAPAPAAPSSPKVAAALSFVSPSTP